MPNDAITYPEAESRRRPSKALIGNLLKRQRGLCATCPAVLAKINNGMVFICAAFDVDHITPLATLGANTDDNLQCLCRACHKAKTKSDIRIIAKGRRVRKQTSAHAERMRVKATVSRAVYRKKKSEAQKLLGNKHIKGRGEFPKGRGFDTTKSRSFDGKVRERAK